MFVFTKQKPAESIYRQECERNVQQIESLYSIIEDYKQSSILLSNQISFLNKNASSLESTLRNKRLLITSVKNQNESLSLRVNDHDKLLESQYSDYSKKQLIADLELQYTQTLLNALNSVFSMYSYRYFKDLY